MAKSREQYIWENSESDYNADVISFSLVDEATVARRKREGDITLPAKKIDIPKDERWNTKQMNSKLLQGILNGDSIPKIAKSLTDVIGNNQVSAVRNARTMTTQAENGGRLDSYKNLEAQGVVQKKVWMATPDDRTRKSHIDIDGEEVDINEEFSNGLMYPADPAGAAEEVWNCRCSMRTHIIGFKKKDGSISKVEYGRDRTLHDEQMAEEKARRFLKGETIGEKKKAVSQLPPDADYSERIKAIAEDVALNGLTDEKIMEAGQILADEINAEIAEKQAIIDKAHEEYLKAGEGRIREIHSDPKYREASNIMSDVSWRGADRINWTRYPNFMNVTDAEAYYKPRFAEISEIRRREEYKAAQQAYSDALKLLNTPQTNAQMLVDKLSKIREIGSEGIDVKAHLRNSRSPMRKDVEYAYSLYPRSWVQASVDRGTLKIGTVNRGYYNDWASELMISGSAGSDSAKETAIHELGHRFEHTIKDMLQTEQSFYDKRTLGEKLEWLGSGYSKSEKTRKDDFVHPYMGKDYSGKAFELNSMGFEYAYFSPKELAKDKDMQAWILGQLAIIP